MSQCSVSIACSSSLPQPSSPASSTREAGSVCVARTDVLKLVIRDKALREDRRDLRRAALFVPFLSSGCCWTKSCGHEEPMQPPDPWLPCSGWRGEGLAPSSSTS